MFTNHIISQQEHFDWFKRNQCDTNSRLYLHLNSKGAPDGFSGLTHISQKDHSAYWGFYCSPDAPKGTGSLLGLDTLVEAFNTLRIHKLNSEVLETNTASVHLHFKLGFSKEGVFRDGHFNGEHYVNVIRFGILSSELHQPTPQEDAHG